MPATVAVAAPGVTLVQDGRAIAKIYMPTPPVLEVPRKGAPVPEAPLAKAVRELNYHLQKMTGAALEIVNTTDPAAVQGPAIVLGETAVKLGAAPQKTTQSLEGFRLLTKGNQVLVGGQSDDAVLLGVYELLRKLGCDWVMPGVIGEVIPRRATLEIPALDESQAPDFLVRRLWYRGYQQPRLPEEGTRYYEWQARQMGGTYEHPVSKAGGHIWDAFIKRHKDEFDKDPTMYALRRAPDGTMKRMGPQLESTHPRVIELFVQEIKDAYARNNWPKDKAAGFGIGPADGLGYSNSAESTIAGSDRIDPIVGEPDRTDLLVLMGNTILEKLGPEYPNAHVGYYVYSTHSDFPMRYQPNPRLVPIFAPINFSRFNAVTDENSKTQAYYKGVVEQWGRLSAKQGNPLFFRGFNWNLAENMLPYTKVRTWGEELPFYKKNHFLGANIEATKAWAINGPSDYVFMHVAWDTTRDWRKVLDTYCANSFGKGALPMRRYLQRLIDTQHGSGQEAGSYHAFHLMYDNAFVAAAEADFAEARRLAETPDQKTRIDYIASGIDALKLYLAYFKATTDFDFPAVKAGYDALQTQWKKTYDINTDLVANEAPAYMKRYLVKFVEQGLKYSTGDYRILNRLPDELPTMFDPNQVGSQMRFQSPALNDSRVIKTKTYSTSWDAQGLTGLRVGAVWYRYHFKLPADAAGKPISLFLGGYEDEARVWINGNLVGTSGRGFSSPAAFDLTDGINYGGENLVAIQIVRNSAANEIGLGGLIRPSFIFTGPRLETKAPKPLELRRILPGGELGEVEK